MAMTRYHSSLSAPLLLLLLTAASFSHLSTSNPLSTLGDIDKDRNTPGLTEDREIAGEESQSVQKQEEAEDEEELFKNVDPKKLAAVLLEALNHSQVERRRGGKDIKEDAHREVRITEGADRDRDGRQELELLMAAQGKEQERGEEEERKKAWEEEKMTEKVTSHTTSQTVQIPTKKQPTSSDERRADGQIAAPQQGSTSLDQASSEEEEQLSPEELKSLEMMMKEFPRVNTATKVEENSEQTYRQNRDYTSYNDIMPINKGSDLAMTKKKLKWQEETQKALSLPTFRGGNFMDTFPDSNYDSNAVDPQALAEQNMEDDEPEEEEDEKTLNPEEEEAQAKAEQEEMRRQAAEAQRAKMEEEKLADIASDMLLQYMVKQNNGNKQYVSSLPNAAEDKRSDEEQEVTEQDDIDPQTIDKLIEISSKLHLPADDVVDIISDVEKKKKKDLAPQMTSRWQQPISTISSPFSSTPQISSNQNNIPLSKLQAPAGSFLKNWFQEKTSTRTEDIWSKPQLGNQNIWSKPQKPIKQDLWPISPKSVWTSYPFFPYTYPFHYQKKSYKAYPIYVPPAPRPKPHYFITKPPLTFSNFLTNSVDDVYTFPPKRRYNSWVQPRQRKPPTDPRHYSHYTSYPLSLYPWAFRPVPIPKSHSLPRIYSQQKQLYYSATAPAVAGKHQHSNHDALEKCIQQILSRRPHMID